MHRINTLEVPGDFCAAETWLYTKPRRSDVVLRLFGLHRQSIQFFSSLPSRKLLRGEVWFSLRTGSVRIIFSFPSSRGGFLCPRPSTFNRYFVPLRLPYSADWFIYRYPRGTFDLKLFVIVVYPRLLLIRIHFVTTRVILIEVKPPPNVTIWIRKVRHGQGIRSQLSLPPRPPRDHTADYRSPLRTVVCIADDNTNAVGVSSYLRSLTIYHPLALRRFATMSFSVEDVGLAIFPSPSN